MKKHENLHFPKILAIDSSDREKVTLGLIQEDQENIVSEFDNRSQDLALNIETFLKKNGVVLSEIRALAVTRNGGSLTGIRMGIATTNTLAYMLNLPILELDSGELTQELGRLKNGKLSPKVVKQTTPLA